MAHHLIPSNATIKSIKAGDARHRLTDGAGLYLRLFVKGGSHGWRFDYSLNGRRNTLSLGTYPDTSLSLARKKADEVRKLVSAGTDPSDVRKETRSEFALRRMAAPDPPWRRRCPPNHQYSCGLRRHRLENPSCGPSIRGSLQTALSEAVFMAQWGFRTPKEARKPCGLS